MTSTILRDAARLKPLLSLFPRLEEVSYAFAYGSAVFEQRLLLGNSSVHQANPNFAIKKAPPPPPERTMIDLVLAVDRPLEWHRENLSLNRAHYSGAMRALGPRWIASAQQHFGAKIFYNTLVEVPGGLSDLDQDQNNRKDQSPQLIKYGVISTADLLNDLLDWETLYIAGRLHKPTLLLHQAAENVDLANALQMNTASALHAALLLQAERFTEEELYLSIAGLSYSGDFRMTFGEDRNKVAKIVRPQVAAFRALYGPLLASDLLKDLVSWSPASGLYHQNTSPTATLWHLNLLPKTVQHGLCREWLAANTTSSTLRKSALERLDLDDLLRRLAFDLTYRSYLKAAIAAIVFRSSWTQSVKGLLTAGLSKSMLYSLAKVRKMVKGGAKQEVLKTSASSPKNGTSSP